MRPTATTRVYALLGDPVAHSLSPVMQNAAIAAAGYDAVYVALRCSAAAVPALMRTLGEAGGGGNVTIPHKSVAAHAVDVASDTVLRTGACNTFWVAGGRLHGENTDVSGFAAAAEELIGSLAGTRVLLLGAGGAAAAALCALVDGGAARIVIANRSVERAAKLAAQFRAAGTTIEAVAAASKAAASASLPGATGEFDLVVNATPLGLHDGDPLPWPVEAASPALLDLVYRPGGTPWVKTAGRNGVAAADGRTMLVAQGEAAFRRWFGAAPPERCMHDAVAAVRGFEGAAQPAAQTGQ